MKPFKSSNITTFISPRRRPGTQVMWTMIGPRPLFMRLFGFFFNMDKIVGKDFEKGLANLKRATAGG